MQPQLVISKKSEQQRIMRTIHEQGHLGQDKVISQVATRYYWKTLYSDVVEMVSYSTVIMVTCTSTLTPKSMLNT